jgi:hypothetical protein
MKQLIFWDVPYKRVLHAIVFLNPKLHLKTYSKNILLNILIFVKQESQMSGQEN